MQINFKRIFLCGVYIAMGFTLGIILEGKIKLDEVFKNTSNVERVCKSQQHATAPLPEVNEG